MKLKNSHILLIVMAIFLLVSIGSVCANDTASTDDAVLADDGSNAVLADETATTDTPKLDTKVVSENVTVSEKDKKVPVAVNDNESNPIEISDKNLTVAEGNTSLKFNYNQSQITITDTLSTGKHNLILTYLGNDVYNKSSTNIVLSVFGDYKIEAPSTVNVNQTNKAEIPINITNGLDLKDVTIDEFNVEVSYQDGNNTTTIIINDLAYANGKLIFTPQFVSNVTAYDINITYNGINNKTLTHKGKLNKVTSIKIIPITTEVDYQAGNFTFKIVDYYNETLPLANIKVSINGLYNGTAVYWDIKQSGGSISLSTTKYVTSDSNGIINIENINFYPGLMMGSTNIYAPVGSYDLTIAGTGEASGSLKTTAKINKIKSKISVEKFSEYVGSSKKLKIVVVNAETGKAISGATLYFKLTDSAGKEVVYTSKSGNTTVKVNQMMTDDNGVAELPMNLVAGKYSIFTNVSESNNYDTSKVTYTATIKEIPVKYSISSTGIVTVTNKLTNKPVSGAYVLLTYDNNKNKMIIAQTNKNGKVAITTVGKHKIKVSDIDSRYVGSTVSKSISNKKITAKISAPKVTAYYKGEKYFTIKVTNSKKKAIYDAKVLIRIFSTSKKYQQYTGNTGINGQIKFLIDMKPKTYKVQVLSGDTKSYTAKTVTSKIVVKKAPAKLTPAKLTAKKGVSKNFKVTVKNTKTKKVIKGVKVKIKVYTGKKYKTFTKKTNKKGVANFNVKTLLKLKVGTHKVVVTSANKYVVAKKAKSTIKITKK